MFTDTDSLCYEIKTDDVYKDLFQDKELFDNLVITQNNSKFVLFFLFFFLKKMR